MVLFNFLETAFFFMSLLQKIQKKQSRINSLLYRVHTFTNKNTCYARSSMMKLLTLKKIRIPSDSPFSIIVRASFPQPFCVPFVISVCSLWYRWCCVSFQDLLLLDFQKMRSIHIRLQMWLFNPTSWVYVFAAFSAFFWDYAVLCIHSITIGSYRVERVFLKCFKNSSCSATFLF